MKIVLRTLGFAIVGIGCLSTGSQAQQHPKTFWSLLIGNWTHMAGDGTDGETIGIDEYGRVAAFTSVSLSGMVEPGAFDGGGNFEFKGENNGSPFICSYKVSFVRSDRGRANFNLVYERGYKFCPSGTYEKTL